jgi:hypothetical protein
LPSEKSAWPINTAMSSGTVAVASLVPVASLVVVPSLVPVDPLVVVGASLVPVDPLVASLVVVVSSERAVVEAASVADPVEPPVPPSFVAEHARQAMANIRTVIRHRFCIDMQISP